MTKTRLISGDSNQPHDRYSVVFTKNGAKASGLRLSFQTKQERHDREII
jgi:hypothetical protein